MMLGSVKMAGGRPERHQWFEMLVLADAQAD